MAARPITPEERDRVAELHAQGLGRNAIARELDRPVGTITNIARDLGLTFDRAATQAATAARQADNRAHRARISTRLLREADQLLDQLHAPFLVFNFGGKDNTYEERTLDRPPTGDIRNLMQSASIALQRHRDLEQLDADAGAAAAKSMLGSLADALGLRRPDDDHA